MDRCGTAAHGGFPPRIPQRLAHLAAKCECNRFRSLSESVGEFKKRERTELRIVGLGPVVKGIPCSGDCGRRFDSPACRVLPEVLPGGRAYGFCYCRRADPLAV